MNQFPSDLFNTKPVPASASETKTIKMAEISISAEKREKPKSREDWRTLVVN